MDDRPFRMDRSGQKKPVKKQPEPTPPPAQPPTEEPAPLPTRREEPAQPSSRPTPRAKVATKQSKDKKITRGFPKLNAPIIIASVAALVLILGAVIYGIIAGSSTGIDNSKYQAVFFTNGQVYFGKLEPFSDEHMRLTDVYYLQQQSSSDDESDSSNPQEASGADGNPTLVKLGNEIHAPEDEMIISKDQILFYENIKADGRVVQSIRQYQNNN